MYYGATANEDRTFLPHAAEIPEAADWEAVRATLPAGAIRCSDPTPRNAYRELRRQIAREAPPGP